MTLCKIYWIFAVTSLISAVVADRSIKSLDGKCVLPFHPENGLYTISGSPVTPGQTFQDVVLDVTCDSGYGVANKINSRSCFDGVWSAIPKCVRICNLYKHPSVEYRCRRDLSTEDCSWQVPSGTVVEPVCRPHYYQPSILFPMRCIDGNWDHISTCKPDCGVIPMVHREIDVEDTELNDSTEKTLPWHALIYTKVSTPYKQICGGSLISTTVIISVAHCFWDTLANKLEPATNYAAAMGKRYRPWNDQRDRNAQKSDVSDVNIPAGFSGLSSNYKDDIAIVIVETPFTYKWHIRPVCIDFDVNIEMEQLQETQGKIAVWDITDTQELKVIASSYVRTEECTVITPQNYRQLITEDKMCTEYFPGIGEGNGGSGLAFPVFGPAVDRYYLRGIASTSPRSDDPWDTSPLYFLTRISKHKHFIKKFI